MCQLKGLKSCQLEFFWAWAGFFEHWNSSYCVLKSGSGRNLLYNTVLYVTYKRTEGSAKYSKNPALFLLLRLSASFLSLLISATNSRSFIFYCILFSVKQTPSLKELFCSLGHLLNISSIAPSIEQATMIYLFYVALLCNTASSTREHMESIISLTSDLSTHSHIWWSDSR